MEFSQLATLLVIAGVFGVISKTLKQPLLVGYLLAGIFLAATGILKDSQSIESLGQIGVALLLFLLGLEMNLRELPEIGKTAVFTGIGQIIFTSTIGFLISLSLGFGLLPSVYIATALSFSSTIIMVKLLSEKKDLSSLYGRISVGFLLVQDFVAIVVLIFLASLGKGKLSFGEYGLVAIKATILLILVWTLSKKILPNLFEKLISSSQELLFIVSIAWALGIASLVAGVGFSFEIGGFLAGLALSNLPEQLQIASKTRPLRDFFLTIFFLVLGTKLIIGGGILPIIPAALVLSFFVLVGNPIIILTIMGFLGYRKRTSFLAGLTVAQISEFSFIIMTAGVMLGHVNSQHAGLIVLVGVVTMTISSYLISYADKIYKRIGKYLSIFERQKTRESAYIRKKDYKDHIILVGCDRTGRVLVVYLQKKAREFLVVDFNPKVFRRLTAEKTPVLFGDINDPEILDVANINSAKMVISTTSDFGDNLSLLGYLRNLKRPPVIIITAATRENAIKLYEKGATYVIVPEITAGEHIKQLFEIPGMGDKRLVKMGKSHFNRLIYK